MDFGQRRLPFFSRSVRKHLRLKQQKQNKKSRDSWERWECILKAALPLINREKYELSVASLGCLLTVQSLFDIIQKKFNIQTVEAEITAMMPLQRACDAENQARNKLSNGPLRAQSNVILTEYSATLQADVICRGYVGILLSARVIP